MPKYLLAFRAGIKRTSRIALVLCLAATTPWVHATASRAEVEYPTRRSLGAELPAYSAPEAIDATASMTELRAEPEGDVTLRGALAAALLRNPDLAAFSWEVRAREARALQAGLRPNPEIALEVENVAGSGDFDGADQAETTVALGQLIELGGKRAKRLRVAELDATLAGWDYEVRRVTVFTEVARAFADVVAAQEAVDLAAELHQLAEELLASVRRRVLAGASSAVEQTRAEVTVSAQQIERRRVDGALFTARLRLAALWGSREARFDAVLGDLREVDPAPSLPNLLAHLDDSPELARWSEEVALRQAVIALEDAKRIPDFTASAGLRRLEESDDTALVFGVRLPFPVYDRNQGARLAAHRDLAKVRHLRRGARVRIETALRTSLSDLSSSYSEVQALREKTLPQATAAHRGVREGYLRGLFRYVDVLDAQRTLFELRTRELDALRRYHAAVADIERLTGAPFGVRSAFDPNPAGTKGTRR